MLGRGLCSPSAFQVVVCCNRIFINEIFYDMLFCGAKIYPITIISKAYLISLYTSYLSECH